MSEVNTGKHTPRGARLITMMRLHNEAETNRQTYQELNGERKNTVQMGNRVETGHESKTK